MMYPKPSRTRKSRGPTRVDSATYRHVEARDGSCVAPVVDRSVDLCDGPLQRDHVRYAAAMGGRRLTVPDGVVLLCRHHHLDGWATSHRPELRAYLATVEPKD